MSRFTLMSFLFLCSAVLWSQPQEKKPKIGLVLSGGGAKGFAHIGALKVIEEAGIKIDYIGGTSMGAVIGGLYACGYNAAQIDSIFHAVDFDKLINDYIPRGSKNFYEKRNDELYAVTLPFNNFKIGIPQALSKGMYNFNLLTRLTRNVKNIKDFNQLPIPFLCIATDIEKGEQVLLNKGNLAQCILASAAFPSLFSPVEIDGKVLIDGGVVNNYPIQEVLDMGADVIIGVDVQDGLKDRTALKDATKILVQITNFNMIEKMKDNVRKTTVYIQPEIKDFSVISFDKGKDIIVKGEEASFAVYEQLKALTGNNQPYQKPKMKIITDSIFIKDIQVNELKNFNSTYVKGKLRFKPGTVLTYDKLQSGINIINGTENFYGINYSLEPNGNGETLILNLKESETKTQLKFGLHYDGLYKSAVLANITKKKLFLKNDNTSLDMIIGDNFRYNLNYYVDNGYNISFGFKSILQQFDRNISSSIQNGDPQDDLLLLNVDFQDWSNQAYFQSVFVQKYLIGAGIEHKHLTIQPLTLAKNFKSIDDSNYFSVFAYLKFDALDSKYFPTKGWSFSGDIHTYFNSSNYSNTFQPFTILKADFSVAVKLIPNLVFKFETDAGTAIGEESVPFLNFLLGGYGFNPINNFKPFLGYDFLSIGGDSYIKTTGILDFEFYKRSHLNFMANFANMGSRIFSTLDWVSFPKYSGYAIGYGLDSIIGPVEVKYSWSPELPKGFVWFSIGYMF
ncbi:patatin-like phospholipase family protein [Flavobacterium sp. RSSA_27]|uniref:patatin-like phospholipase family protein n=1 Tax=Flavobacterium sp. RSSA_27 TaxID=3447667 RepID=UPI003F37EEEC